MDYAVPISFNWAPVFADISPDQTSSTFNIYNSNIIVLLKVLLPFLHF